MNLVTRMGRTSKSFLMTNTCAIWRYGLDGGNQNASITVRYILDICDDTVVIQCNHTEDLIATELTELGIPREQIRLGFLPPDVDTKGHVEANTSADEANTSPAQHVTHSVQLVSA